MGPQVAKRSRQRIVLPMISLLVILLASFYVLSNATENTARFSGIYDWILVVNLTVLLVLFVMIAMSILRLVRQYRAGVAGSRLTARLVLVFVVLSVIPVSIVYYFSLQFLQRGVDSWFDVRIEQSLEDALELSQVSLGLRQREVLKLISSEVDNLSEISEGSLGLSLSDILDRTNAVELSLLGSNNRIIAFSSADPARVVPLRGDEDILRGVRQGKHYVGIEPIKDAGLHIRVVYPLPISVSGDSEPRLLQALFPLDQRLSKLADNVQEYFTVYKRLNYLRGQLKNSFLLTLSMVLLLSLLAAVWVAFFAAQRLMAPVRNLAEGTQAVADGDYHMQLPAAGQHELGFLVNSFNDMIRRIAQASTAAQHSQQQAEAQHDYLQAVMSNLSSGVLTLDNKFEIKTVNAAAGAILGLDFERYVGQKLDAITEQHAPLTRFVDSIKNLSDTSNKWQQEVILFISGGRKVLMCRGSTLIDEQGVDQEKIIVFDDITEQMQAQRDSAWGEVARRLAHEIKNPLTPIQLSAERMQHKLQGKLEEAEQRVLSRSTETIVQQVKTMKEMVNAFADYARAPKIVMQRINLNALILEVSEMYKKSDLHLIWNLDDRTPMIQADTARLRQLLHNLIKNALEAMEAVSQKEIEITTRCMDESGSQFVEFSVRDDGDGFPEEALGQCFEPYVTNKAKGTGLGLAIVKKIVEEHGGMVMADNLEDHGAVITIRLPVIIVKSDPSFTERRKKS